VRKAPKVGLLQRSFPAFDGERVEPGEDELRAIQLIRDTLRGGLRQCHQMTQGEEGPRGVKQNVTCHFFVHF